MKQFFRVLGMKVETRIFMLRHLGFSYACLSEKETEELKRIASKYGYMICVRYPIEGGYVITVYEKLPQGSAFKVD